MYGAIVAKGNSEYRKLSELIYPVVETGHAPSLQLGTVLIGLIPLSTFFLDLLLNDSVYDSYGSQVHDITGRAFYVGEVDRFVQSHLDRADRLGDTQRIQ